MRRTKRSLAVALICLSVAPVFAGCKTEHIRDISSPVPVGLSTSQVADAIAAGAARRRWMIVDKSPGRVIARIDVRASYMAEVEISFDARSYKIAYHDSENLKTRTGRIHQNYLRWIANLDQAVRAELVRAATANPSVER